jgi:hypothetical protein
LDEVTGLRNLHNEELDNLCNSIGMIKSRDEQACSTQRGEDEFMWVFVGKSRMKETTRKI